MENEPRTAIVQSGTGAVPVYIKVKVTFFYQYVWLASEITIPSLFSRKIIQNYQF